MLAEIAQPCVLSRGGIAGGGGVDRDPGGCVWPSGWGVKGGGWIGIRGAVCVHRDGV